jgi:hypothetical protein
MVAARGSIKFAMNELRAQPLNRDVEYPFRRKSNGRYGSISAYWPMVV